MILLFDNRSLKYALLIVACFVMATFSGCCVRVKNSELLPNSAEGVSISAAVGTTPVVVMGVQHDGDLGQSIADYIDYDRSFATSPSNQKFLLDIRPNEYLSNKYRSSSYTSDLVGIISPNGDKGLLEWEDGVWQFDLYLLTGYVPKDHIHIEFKLWRSWYCPLIHGPPN